MALSVGTSAPDFTLLDAEKQPVSLSSFRGQKVVLAFFPAAFTGVCTAEMCSFQNAIQRLNGMNAVVLGVSADLPFSNGGFAKANDLTYPLLSDWTMATINAYDVAFENFAGIQGLTRSSRATFIIDAEGIIRNVSVTANPGVEPNYDEIYDAVEAL
ncbi:MAG: peroxiredoxin [Candidatus Kapabacteria bacterium]|nr:peroxiredoxin [Candidatus Kapabacteria bacterium]